MTPLTIRKLSLKNLAYPFLLSLFTAVPGFAHAQDETTAAELKKLSIEELMNIRVSLASRTPQKLSEVASAIQVLTNEDIRRSGATNIPEALRLFPNIQVAQFNSSAWMISARGFNTVYANKLLVMIDGRTVYTPLFGGVIWNLHNLLLEDVDRIEVVSGPGGSLWGANAVNGVINIITRKAAESEGFYASVTAGTFLKDVFEARYGGKIGDDVHFRVYGQHFDRGATTMPGGAKNPDAWRSTQGGFKVDWTASAKDELTVQGDYYSGLRKTPVANSKFNGQNILARWTRTISSESDLSLQVYYDKYFYDDVPGTGSDKMNTVDLDFQHRFPAGKAHNILWGLGYRFVKDISRFSTNFVGILPPEKNLDMFNSFIQDEITLSNRLKLTLGTKLLHNVYTGVEIQPTARMAFSVKTNNTLWAAVSRAVRTPSRYDVDYFLPAYTVPPPDPSVAGGPNFVSEKLVAFELGYRIQPNEVSTFSVSTFYNIYDDVYSVEALPNTLTFQIQNGSEAKSWGIELSGAYQLTPWWRIRGGYTFFEKNLQAKPGHEFDPAYLGNDANHIVLLQSVINLPGNLQLDIAGRYLDRLPATLATAEVPAYATFDARFAWVKDNFEIAVVGQNLASKNHTEFNVFNMPRNGFVRVATRF